MRHGGEPGEKVGEEGGRGEAGFLMAPLTSQGKDRDP